MKYENLQIIVNTCEQIQKHQEKLDLLERFPTIKISTQQGRYIDDIDVAPSQSNHEYYKLGESLVDAMKVDLRTRIKNMKEQLETL